MSDWAALLTAVSGLVSAVVWPAVVVAIVLVFKTQIGGLLKSDDLSLTGPGGLSLVAKRKTAEATGALVEASRSRGDSPLTQEQAKAEVAETERHLQAIDDPVVLWVDDIPSDTEQERRAMEALGISFDLSVDTEGALQKLKRRRYDAVLSDMGRAEGDRAGYDLIDRMRHSGDTTPVVFYTSSDDPEHFNEAVEHDAVGSTNRASELMQMVVAALKITARARPATASGRDRSR